MEKKLCLVLSVLCLVLGAFGEGVRYRGIFINDEDWSLRPWAVRHFGTREQIGTNAYREVFRLMEEDGLNLIWPAMHEGGYEFSERPENLALAKAWGIAVGTSHCEPMLRNNCYIPKKDRELWSWTKHRDFVEDYWREGVRRGKDNEVLWTIGMRGIHDGGMKDGKTRAEKIAIMESVFAFQTKLLREGERGEEGEKVEEVEERGGGGESRWTADVFLSSKDDKFHCPHPSSDRLRGSLRSGDIPPLFSTSSPPPPKIPPPPQTLFCPYKEVLPLYNAGLKVPEGTVIMWVNDNFGYVRRIGGNDRPQGIYWHLSYHGYPHGYIHLCTTPPAFMWYELVAKCWGNGVRDVWMVNAGDVFQAELLLYCYGKMAAAPDAWGADAQEKLLAQFISEKLEVKSEKLRKRIAEHLAEYFTLGFIRKPEHMCIHWTQNLPATVKSELLARYEAFLAEDLAIEKSLGGLGSGKVEVSGLRDARDTRDKETTTAHQQPKSSSTLELYFRLIGFQARFLAHAGIIHLTGKDKDYAYSVLNSLYARWDKLEGGKWSGFWCDTVDERGGKRQKSTCNRWSTQMQWSWNEPDAKAQYHGTPRRDYPATAYCADVPEPRWLEPCGNVPAKDGAWTRVKGLGTSGRALALLPVKPGKGVGATLAYDLEKVEEVEERGGGGESRWTADVFLSSKDDKFHCPPPPLFSTSSPPPPKIPPPPNFSTSSSSQPSNPSNSSNTSNPLKSLVIQFLPDYALWPGLKLGVNVRFDGGAPAYVAVPKSDSNIGEKDRVRNQAVQDNFIRVEIPIPSGARQLEIVATDPGVVVDRVGVR